MDPNAIYIKTAAGEEAIQQRARVIQRNVRMVLILVDGHSTIADLSRKIGDMQLIRSAIAELEVGGFIEPKAERQNSFQKEDQKVTQKLHNAVTEIEDLETLERETDNVASQQISNSKPVKFKSNDPYHNNASGSSPTPNENDSLNFRFFLDSDEPSFQRDMSLGETGGNNGTLSSFQETADALTRKRSSTMGRLKSLFLPRASTIDEDFKREIIKNNPVKIKPIRRRSAKKYFSYGLGWPITFILSILVLVVLCGLAIILFPYDIYIKDVETAFSGAIGRSVKLGTMQVDVYPVAGLTLRDVKIGEGKDEVRIGEIQLQPDPTTLFSPRKIFQRVVLSNLSLPLGDVNNLTSVFSALNARESTAGVRQIHIKEMDISFAGINLKRMQAEIRLDSAEGFQTLAMQSASRNINVVLKPQEQKINVALDAYAWVPREESDLLFDSANLEGQLEDNVFSVSAANIRLADGVIQGTAAIKRDANLNIVGDISFERINISRLSNALNLGTKFTGDAAGKMNFQVTADSWTTILSSIYATSDFSIQRGSVIGIDIVEAVRRTSGTPVQGGITSFEQLSGKMNLSPGRHQFFSLTMNSGLIQSTGYVHVTQGNALNGRLELQIKGSANQTRTPISVDGTLALPVVQARKDR